MISVDNITVRFGGFTLFDRVSFQVNKGDRIGFVGRNGAGKTTLLNLVKGLQMPDEGKVVKTDGVEVGYLPQQMKHRGSKSLYNDTLEAFSEVLKLEKQIESLNKELGERTDYESESYMDLIGQVSQANEQFDLEGGNSIHADIEQTLRGLGFLSSDMDRSVREFSGGWRMRIELAKILLRRPDYILLDEPTNRTVILSTEIIKTIY